MTRPNNQTTVIVAHQFETLEQQFDADLLGMWLFLVTEALLFSGAFLALAVYYHQYYDTFSAAARELHWLLAGFNSVILLTSGLAVALAEQAADQHRRRLTLWWLSATIALGLAFLGLKGYEYYMEYRAGLTASPSDEVRAALNSRMKGAREQLQPIEAAESAASINGWLAGLMTLIGVVLIACFRRI